MENILTVTQLNQYIKKLISEDLYLSDVYVSGEVSNLKYHSSGHIYFTLKDSKALIKCVMFRSRSIYLKFRLKNGIKIIARGYVSIYEAGGQYQLYLKEIVPDGIGSLHIAYEQLKEKLYKEGLFDEVYKKKIPMLPSAIGVITSKTGAVIRDIINVLYRRYSNANLKLYPAAVQGESAAREIAMGIKAFNQLNNVDIIIVARGGGSLEDLWPFNEEIVARAIFDSKIPIISAVGHETDFSISDFVADLRAPTPSAAAELVIAEKAALISQLDDYKKRLTQALLVCLKNERLKLENLMKSTVFKRPFDRLNQERQNLDLTFKTLCASMEKAFETNKNRLKIAVEKLGVLSPLTVLSRGYSVVLKEGDVLVKSVNDVDLNETVEMLLQDGSLICEVKKKGERVYECRKDI